MAFYRLLVGVENIDIPVREIFEEQDFNESISGFYTTLFIWSQSKPDAIEKSRDVLLQRWKAGKYRHHNIENMRITETEITKLSLAKGIFIFLLTCLGPFRRLVGFPTRGYTFFTDNEEKV